MCKATPARDAPGQVFLERPRRTVRCPASVNLVYCYVGECCQTERFDTQRGSTTGLSFIACRPYLNTPQPRGKKRKKTLIKVRFPPLHVKQKDLDSFRFGCFFCLKIVVYEHCLVTLPTQVMKHQNGSHKCPPYCRIIVVVTV